MSSLKAYLINLNLFKSTDDTNHDEHRHRSNILATRIYLVVLILALTGLALGLWLTLQTTKIEIRHPSKDQVKALPIDAQCPCSRLSISYGEFTTLETSVHQVCSSDFVSDRWIKAIFPVSNWSKLYPADFRTIGSAQFQVLASLCRLSKKNVLNSLTSFYATPLVGSLVLSESLLESTVQASIKQFQLTMYNTFQSQLQLLSEMTFGNKLISGLKTSILPTYIYDDLINDEFGSRWPIPYISKNGTPCHCYKDYNCRKFSGFYDGFEDKIDLYLMLTVPITPAVEIPGFFAGCMPLNSLLYSTLECFYNQTCVNTILSLISTNHNFTAITLLEQSHFKPNSTVQMMVDRTMVEQWTTNISYDRYFAQCTPVLCTYSKVDRHGFTFVLSKVIGLLGGLISMLTFIIPLVVRFIRRLKLTDTRSNPRIPVSTEFHQLKIRLKRFLTALNLFSNQSVHDRHVHYQRTGTRLYILILIISLVTVTQYSLLTQEIHQETVVKPSESHYTTLEKIYGKRLVCPCNNVSVAHHMFISIRPVYHQICSSDFVSSQWIDLLLEGQFLDFMALRNEQANIGIQFPLLNTFCKSIQQTVDDALRVFLQAQFVSAQVTAEQIFHLQIQSLIRDWQLSISNRYQRVIQLIRATNQGNQLMNDFFNVKLQVNHTTNQVSLVAKNYSNCSCALTGSCRIPFTIDDQYVENGPFIKSVTFSNFFTGCFPVDALLQSTLECLYNQTFVTVLKTYLIMPFYDGNETLNFSTLAVTHLVPNETIETVNSIVDRLMVDLWVRNVSFASYYNACAPISCTFEYTSRRRILIVVITVISILGGLSTGLEILILIVVRFAEKIIDGYFRLSLLQFIRKVFTCSNEQQMARRFHFVLIVITLFISYFVLLLLPQFITVQIVKPSYSVYQESSPNFSDTFQCSCSKIAFKHRSFLTIKPRFHQLCSSEFMSDNWIAYAYDEENLFNRFNRTDFGAQVIGQFQLLVSLCQLSQKAVHDSLLQLDTTDYINAQLISPTLLNKRINTTISEFQLRTSKSFLDILDLIREMTGANELMSIYGSGWKFDDFDISTQISVLLQPTIPLHTAPVDYQGCNCGLSSKCTQPLRGMMAGCYPLEALLQSTLQCFYDQQCIDLYGRFKALNSSSISSRFDINSTVEFILQELMVEEYLKNVSYENYYAACAPFECSYSYIGHRNTIDTVTPLIELYGGLVIITEWITALIIILCRRRTERQINPQIQ